MAMAEDYVSPGPSNSFSQCSHFCSEMIAKSHKMVTVQSNSDGEKYQAAIHAELLCYYSTYYKAAIKGQFLESKQDTFTLDLGYLATRAFVAWLYSGHLEDRFENDDQREGLYALYVFADKTDILALRRSVMQYLPVVSEQGDRTAVNDHIEVCSQLPERCGLVRFLFDESVSDWEDHCDPSTSIEEPTTTSSFMRRVYPENIASRIISGFADTMARKTRGEEIDIRTNLRNGCNYHEHENREEWELSK